VPVRKGARIVKEISWRWREIGADARICDLLDSQVGAIEGACEQISSADSLAGLNAAFDLLKARIGGFEDSDKAAPEVAETEVAAVAPATSAAPDETPVIMAEQPQPTGAADDTDAAISQPTETAAAVDVTVEVVATTAEAPEAVSEIADRAADTLDEAASEASGDSAAAADAYDEALLDMVALEMGAPDDADIDDGPDEADTAVETAPAEPVMVDETPAIIAAQPEPVAAAVEPPPVQASLQPSPEPLVEPSLGSTLLANGILRKFNPSSSDPLVPIRRMSQAEKIAFFS
jgi:hypothetical protein